jgi:hypothetical protein
MIKSLRQYATTAAVVASFVFSGSAIASLARDFMWQTLPNYEKISPRTLIGASSLATLVVSVLLIKGQRKHKEEEEERETLEENARRFFESRKSQNLKPYIEGLKALDCYSSDYIDLLKYHLCQQQFIFKDNKYETKFSAHFDYDTWLIHFPKIPDECPENLLLLLVHELTHALEPRAIRPYKMNYLDFMRKKLCEEIIACSSERLPLTKKILEHAQKNIEHHIFMLPMIDKNDSFWEFLQKLAKDTFFSQEDKETLLELCIYNMLSKKVFLEMGFPSNIWISGYTKDYNTCNQTNYPLDQTFEPPLVPPTLARAVQDIFGSFPKWVGNFCEVLNSDQLSSEQKSAVTNAIHALFEANENIRISVDFLMENISLKYDSRQDAIDAFQRDLCDAMGENYPPVLSKSHIFKNISEEHPSSIPDFWHKITGIDPETLALAAQQTEWPMFKSDIEAAALSQQKDLNR